MTKKLQNTYRLYKASNNYTLRDVYKSWSWAKEKAWRYCQELCEQYNGTGLKIIGANSQTFSIGFEYMNAETGEAMFLHHTAYNTYTAPITSDLL